MSQEREHMHQTANVWNVEEITAGPDDEGVRTVRLKCYAHGPDSEKGIPERIDLVLDVMQVRDIVSDLIGTFPPGTVRVAGQPIDVAHYNAPGDCIDLIPEGQEDPYPLLGI